jgi:hypothetical protein
VNVEENAAPIAVTSHSSDIPSEHLNKYGQKYAREKANSY